MWCSGVPLRSRIGASMTTQAPRTLPLSAAQTEMCFAQQLDPGNPIYNTGGYLELEGALDVPVFEAALRRTVQEAEYLRVRFVVVEDQPRQIVEGRDGWPFP